MDRETEFRRLYQANRVPVHAYFTGRSGDRDRAADLMQEVFVRVWRHLPELAGLDAGRQRAWIFTVARNLSIDENRQARTRAAALNGLAQTGAGQAETPASAAVIGAERVAAVGAAIRALPEQQRVTLAMASAGEMTSAEIGSALGIAAGTVRYRLAQARHALAEALDRYDHPEAER